MPSTFDPYMPRIQMQFPDGAVLSIGTLSCEDQIHQAVYLAYTHAGSSTPAMELELPPKSVEIIIQQLQEHANHARFINGERMLVYPKPYPVVPPGASRRKRKAPRRKKAIDQPSASPEGSPSAPVGNSGVEQEPPPVS